MASTYQPQHHNFALPPPPRPQRQQSAKRTPRLVLQYHRNRYSGASAMLNIPPPPKTAPLLRPAPTHRESGYTASVYSERAFDDLYDVTDDEREEVPLKVSDSFKKFLNKNDKRRESLPSLIIPSPTAWPTIEKLRLGNASTVAPKSPEVPLMAVKSASLSPAALAGLAKVQPSLRVPGAASTPSLDGSLNSDEVASMSPSTPDMRLLARSDGWDVPMQLNAQAMETLQHLSPEFTQELLPIVESPELEAGEMKERGLNIALAAPAAAAVAARGQHHPLPDAELVSAISLPSPGGFLASLTPSTRNAWALPSSVPCQEEQQPSTATAETFYDIPWQARSGNRIVEQIISAEENGTDGPPTARQDCIASVEHTAAEMIIKPREYEYDDQYEQKLYETAASNKTRTSHWLNAQETYLSALRGNNPANADTTSPRISQETASTPHTSPSLKSPSTSSSGDFKKAVRFASGVSTDSPQPSRNDPLFYHAFQHLTFASRPNDAFDLGRIRADALQAQRLYLSTTHQAQLRGSYCLAAPKKPVKDFAHLPTAPNDPAVQQQRDAVAQADRERQALTQISLAQWYLEGSRLLSGGALIPRSVRESLKAAREAGRTPRVLDLGGISSADFGWALALEERDAKIYTATVRSDERPEVPAHRGPSNHRALVIDAPWKLPFRDATFDVVSARSLHALLRTRRGSSSGESGEPFAFPFGSDLRATSANDEWALTLSEIYRVLRPGGQFHYHLLDAELCSTASTTHTAPAEPVSALQTRSVEFAVALRSLGYDPAAGHHSTTRLTSAGFARDQVCESWVELPVGGRGGVGPADVADVTELVGSVSWERWILATRGERGLEGLGSALEDARKGGRRCGWRVLVGVARR